MRLFTINNAARAVVLTSILAVASCGGDSQEYGIYDFEPSYLGTSYTAGYVGAAPVRVTHVGISPVGYRQYRQPVYLRHSGGRRPAGRTSSYRYSRARTTYSSRRYYGGVGYYGGVSRARIIVAPRHGRSYGRSFVGSGISVTFGRSSGRHSNRHVGIRRGRTGGRRHGGMTQRHSGSRTAGRHGGRRSGRHSGGRRGR